MRKIFKKCFRVIYSYHDPELGNMVETTDYVKDVPSLIAWFVDLDESLKMVDASRVACRENIDIKIKQVFIPEKKYISLFNN